jgi:hypothetical protein
MSVRNRGIPCEDAEGTKRAEIHETSVGQFSLQRDGGVVAIPFSSMFIRVRLILFHCHIAHAGTRKVIMGTRARRTTRIMSLIM